MTNPIIVWFRRDLRLADNPALAVAAANGPVIPVYIHDDDPATGRPEGGASRWWLHHSLKALDRALGAIGSRLILRHGPARQVLPALIHESGARIVHVTRRYEPNAAAEDEAVADLLKRDGVSLRRFGGALLAEPESLATKEGRPFKVFTPFYKALLTGLSPADPKPAPNRLVAPSDWPVSERLDDWSLLPTKPDWAGGLRENWKPGEAGATDRLEAFLEGPMADYATKRDRPDQTGTSQLSPHLHFGEVGPRQVWHRAVVAAQRLGPGFETGSAAFLRQLAWRDFSYHLLHHWPNLPEIPFRPAFTAFPWRDNPEDLAAWQAGRTGYPLVDAGMRELWTTGWMHNRVRMIAASFLTKHLLIPWQEGEAWFWETLVDADPANNAASWQWVAGSGADAAPYFRIFNPVSQGRKFDPQGVYVRRWLPELAGLSDAHIHQPWAAPCEALRSAGIGLGETYPMPIVDHATARRRALDAFEKIKRS